MKLPIVIEDSPIEFVLTGPFAGSDQVIVKSTHAQLDLVGATIFANFDGFHRRNTVIDTLFYTDRRQVNVTQGSPYEDVLGHEDARISDYFFAWSGQARSVTREEVSILIDKRIHNIVKSIRENNVGALEWHLSAPLHIITENNEYYKARRRTFRLILGMYVALVAVALTVHFATKYFPI